MSLFRASAAFAALLLAGLTASATPPAPALQCEGAARQSGLLICMGPADRDIRVSGPDGENTRTVHTDAAGQVLIGLRQDETSTITLETSSGDDPGLTLDIARRDDEFRLIKGFDCDKVDARTPAQKQHAADSWIKKQDAFARFNKGPGVQGGFIKPAKGPTTSPFGPTRKYVGTGGDGKPCEKVSVHEGYDFGVPVGTPIVAPAGGTVVLADPDLYYEGGTVFLDHGGGLVSVFLHMSNVGVEAGDVVEQGDRLGASGNTGRTTGPHLHWAVKWRNPANESRDGDFYIDPALLLALDTGTD